MTKKAQQIAIAEACGWTRDERGWIMPDGTRAEHNEALDVSYRVVQHDPPDYPNDLNAMHEAEGTLTKEHCYQYSEILSVALGHWRPSIGPSNWPFHATASQRAEAFMRTKGLWVEERVEASAGK